MNLTIDGTAAADEIKIPRIDVTSGEPSGHPCRDVSFQPG